MAKYIKKLSGAHPDAIATAMQTVHLTQSTIKQLKELSDLVSKAPISSDERRTPDKDFLQYILPRLEKVMREHRTNPGGLLVDPVHLIELDLNEATLNDLVDLHTRLSTSESSLKTQLLFIRYQRGCIYRKAHEFLADFDDFKAWLLENFAMSYGTASAYISVAILLESYPMLMKAELSFEQLRRHGKRIKAYFEANPEFGMDESCDITVGNNTVTVRQEYAEEIRDSAPQHADFELFTHVEEKETDFPHFAVLTDETQD